jgi:hypothetical protein
MRLGGRTSAHTFGSHLRARLAAKDHTPSSKIRSKPPSRGPGFRELDQVPLSPPCPADQHLRSRCWGSWVFVTFKTKSALGLPVWPGRFLGLRSGPRPPGRLISLAPLVCLILTPDLETGRARMPSRCSVPLSTRSGRLIAITSEPYDGPARCPFAERRGPPSWEGRATNYRPVMVTT